MYAAGVTGGPENSGGAALVQCDLKLVHLDFAVRCLLRAFIVALGGSVRVRYGLKTV